MDKNACTGTIWTSIVLACALSACQQGTPAPVPQPTPPKAADGRASSVGPSPTPQPATPSQYTALAGDACDVLKVDVEAGGSSKRCPGVGGYRLIVQDSDARMSLDVVPPSGDPQPLELWHLAGGAFSGLGEVAEWRLDRDGLPIALIVRYNAYLQPEQPGRATSHLVVAKLEPAACIVEVMPPGAGQNERARDVADAAAGMACRTPPDS